MSLLSSTKLLSFQQSLDIQEAETKFREAFRIAETNYRRSQQLQHQNALMVSFW